MICGVCGNEYSDSSKFCVACGAPNVSSVAGGGAGGASTAGERTAPTAPKPAPGIWFIHANDSNLGPYTAAEMSEFIRKGRVRAGDYAWRHGMADWSQISEIKEFSADVNFAGRYALEILIESPDKLAAPKSANYTAVSMTDVFAIVQERHKIPLLILMGVMIVSIVCFTIANIQSSSLESPVQLQVRADDMFLSTTRAIYKFDSSGSQAWRADNANGSLLNGLLDFDFDDNGNIFVANPFHKRIEVFDPDGAWLYGFGDADLGFRFTFLILDNGNVAVADAERHDAKLFTSRGDLLKQTGGSGREPGQFMFPNGIAQLPDRTVLISETNNLRIQRFSRDLENLIEPEWPIDGAAAFPPRGEAAPDFALSLVGMTNPHWPTRMLADPARKRIYVAYADDLETPRGYVGVFNFDGKLQKRAWLTATDGGHIDARTMRLTSDGMVSFVDIDDFKAGVWDPKTTETTLIENGDIGKLLTVMGRSHRSNRALDGTAKAAFGLTLVMLCFVLVYSLKIREELATGRMDPAALSLRKQNAKPPSRTAALVLSALWPGAGQLYLRRFVFGAALMLLWIVLIEPIFNAVVKVHEVGYIRIAIDSTHDFYFEFVWILIPILAVIYLAGLIHAAFAEIER